MAQVALRGLVAICIGRDRGGWAMSRYVVLDACSHCHRTDRPLITLPEDAQGNEAFVCQGGCDG